MPRLQFWLTEITMDFTLWVGPIPLHWVASIEDASAEGFTDRQLRGPFAAWAHHHSFVRVDDRTTDVVDEVAAKLKRHPFWGLAGALMSIGMPVLFARIVAGRRDGYWKLEAGMGRVNRVVVIGAGIGGLTNSSAAG